MSLHSEGEERELAVSQLSALGTWGEGDAITEIRLSRKGAAQNRRK